MCHPAVFTAMGASTTTAATLAAVAPTIIGVTGSSMLGMQQAKAQQKYAAAQHKLEQEAVSDEARQRRIESLQKENVRKQDYLDRLASNRATLAGMGISEQGGSIRALLQENKNIPKYIDKTLKQTCKNDDFIYVKYLIINIYLICKNQNII